MLVAILRSTGALVASLIVALLLIIAVEIFGEAFHPFPPGVDTSDLEVCKAHVAKFPQWMLAVVVILWGATMLISCWLATRLGTHQHPAHGWAIGILILGAAVFNMILLPYPIWFKIANLLVLPGSIFYANRAAKRCDSATE